MNAFEQSPGQKINQYMERLTAELDRAEEQIKNLQDMGDHKQEHALETLEKTREVIKQNDEEGMALYDRNAERVNVEYAQNMYDILIKANEKLVQDFIEKFGLSTGE